MDVESPQDRKRRLGRLRQQRWIAKQNKESLEKIRKYRSENREKETIEQKTKRQKINRINTRMKRQAETNAEKIARRQRASQRMAELRRNESEEKKMARRKYNAERTALKRANKSEEEHEFQKQLNAERTALRRAYKSEEELEFQKQLNAESLAVARLYETEDQAILRRQLDRQRKAYKRANETEEEKKKRQEVDAKRKAELKVMKSTDETDESSSEAMKNITQNCMLYKKPAPIHRRRPVTLKLKMAVLDQLERGLSVEELSEMTMLPESTIRIIGARKEQILTFMKIHKPSDMTMGLLCMRESLIGKMELELSRWISEQTKPWHEPSYSEIQHQARTIFEDLKAKTGSDEVFVASFEWLDHYRKRMAAQEFPDSGDSSYITDTISEDGLMQGEHQQDDMFSSEEVKLKQESKAFESLSTVCGSFNEIEMVKCEQEMVNFDEKNDDDDVFNSNSEMPIKCEVLSDLEDCDEENPSLRLREDSSIPTPEPNVHQCNCNAESKEDTFAKIISEQLKEIRNLELYNITKWNIQGALMEGLRKQLKLDKPKSPQ
ncbi:uncharacterized protein LOC143909755 [Arctopsyche grandis]|uniref:uncharacterized protein LOC143909755 n=1 Tax=Arctopsyche grandis TaxID=121162 RepID=UPI00406D8C47